MSPGAFTIVEVLTVVVIIALLAGVGGGIYIGTHKGLLVRKSGREFLLAAKYARELAISRQSRCEIQVDTKEKKIALVIKEFDAASGETMEAVVKDLHFKPFSLPGEVEIEDVKIRPLEGGGYEEEQMSEGIVFLPNGRSQQATIQLGDGQRHITISISAATGRARLYDGQMENVEPDVVDLDAG